MEIMLVMRQEKLVSGIYQQDSATVEFFFEIATFLF